MVIVLDSKPLLKFNTESAPSLSIKCNKPSVPTYVLILEVSSLKIINIEIY